MAEVSKARQFFDMVAFYCKHKNDYDSMPEGDAKEFMREIVDWKYRSIDAYVKQVQLRIMRMGEKPSEWNLDESIRQCRAQLDALIKEKELMESGGKAEEANDG